MDRWGTYVEAILVLGKSLAFSAGLAVAAPPPDKSNPETAVATDNAEQAARLPPVFPGPARSLADAAAGGEELT